MNYSSSIHRIDFPVRDRTNGLTLGPGLVINQIPYYYVTVRDEQGAHGSAWSVSSPLWGGYPPPLKEGMDTVESLLLDITRHVLQQVQQSTDLLSDIRHVHEAIYDNPDNPWTQENDVPPLIKGMVLAPIMGALVDYLGKKHNLSAIDILRRITTIAEIFSEKPLFDSLAPFFTIGGKDSAEKITSGIAEFGSRPVYKFKAGSLQSIEREAEWMRAVFSNLVQENALCVIDVNRAYTSDETTELLTKLKKSGFDERVLFIEQSGGIGEEPSGFDKAFASVNAVTAVCADESAYSSASVNALGQKISANNPRSVIIVPKFEKGGPIEIVRMLEAAHTHGMYISPSTLTGPPAHLVYYGHIFSHVKNIYTIPGSERSIGMEANFYEICDQDFAVHTVMKNTDHDLFNTHNPFLPITDCAIGYGWPKLADINPVENIPWDRTMSASI